MMLRCCLIVSLIFIKSAFLQGQEPWKKVRVSVDNGLSQNSVWHIVQDNMGYLWVGTASGVDRWDGVNFVNYQNTPNDTSSLSGRTSFRFHVDSIGNLWIIHDKGITLYNYISGKMINLLHVNFTCIMLGEINGYLFILTAPNEITQIQTKTLKSKKTFINNLNYTYKISRSTPFAAQSGHWMFYNNSGNEVTAYNAVSGEIKVFSFSNETSCPFILNKNTVVSIYGDSVALWFNTNGDSLVKTNKFVKGLNSKQIITGKIYRELIWLCSENGLIFIDTSTWVCRTRNGIVEPSIIDKEFIYNITEDNVGNLYLCSNINGFYIFSELRNRFPLYIPSDARTTIVKSIAVYEGVIFMGLYKGGLSINYGDKSKTIENLSNIEKPDNVWGLHILDTSSLIAITDHEWIIYDWKKRKIIDKTLYNDKAHHTYPYFLAGKRGGWVNLKNENESVIYKFNEYGKIEKSIYEANMDITCFQFMKDSSLIIGGKDKLLHYKNGSNNILINNVWVKSICKSKNGNIYVGTTSGCYVLDEKLVLKKILTIKDGLPDNFIYGILEDNHKNIWMSTNKGLACYSLIKNNFRNYSVINGLQSNEFNTGAYYKDQYGFLYFGGIGGVNKIDPNSLKFSTKGPKIVVSKIMIGDQEWYSDTAFNELKEIILSYWNSTISFDFLGCDYSIHENNVFRYRLDPLDRDWFNSNTKHFSRFVNLPSGQYVFRVQAANSDGFWGPEKSIIIRVIPPFWERWWFYSIEILFVMSILLLSFFIIKKRQQRIWQYKYEIADNIDKERKRISKDLHDHIGSQLVYIISGLKNIKNHVEVLDDIHTINNKIDKLISFGTDAIQTLRETIWAINLKNISVEDFADRLKKYVLRVKELHYSNEIEFIEELNNLHILMPETILNLFRICQEIFINSIKHSKASLIKILFYSDEKVFSIKIEDNGIGFVLYDIQSKEHYGLKNIYSRAKEIGASICIQSDKGKGTSIEIVIPIKQV